MNSKAVIVFLVTLVCLVHVANSWVAIENAAIQDEGLLKQGYSCKSINADPGLMKNGQEIILKNTCAKASCHQGTVSYTGCGSVSVDVPGCYLVEDLTLPFPNCCKTVKCDFD